MLKRFRQASFVTRLFVALVIFSLVVMGIVGVYINQRLQNQLYSLLGERALVQAKEIAVIPSLVDAVQHQDIPAIAQLITKLRKQADASYIVIGDRKGNHLFHTENTSLRGPMVGGDNDAVLNGESITSIRHGTLGISLRGKAPIFDKDYHVIGIVSVGYLQTRIDTMHFSQLLPLLVFLSTLLIALFIFSWLFAHSIKRQMFGLEPSEISRLVRQQDAILEGIYEGIIAIDTRYSITAINQAARSMLNIREQPAALIGRALPDIVTPTNFFCAKDNVIADKHDEICYFNQLLVLASRIRILINGRLEGWVISFRDKNDINTLSLQLSQIRKYTDALRAIRHEHLNWIATLSGLLHMQQYDQAIAMIEAQSAGNQQILDFLSQHFALPSICGLLLGKYVRAHELGLVFSFDPACQLETLPDKLDETELISIIGNLLDNAFEAVRYVCQYDPEPARRVVEFYLSDAGDELVIEVADQGSGISEEVRENIYERGVTTNINGDHGIGLFLVNTIITKVNGVITFNENTPYGTIFSIFIPKQGTKPAR